jgi:hypothetical protein
MTGLRHAIVPDSAPLGTRYRIGSRTFTARADRSGTRIWVATDRRFAEVVLMRTDAGRYVVAPWLEEAAPRAIRELIRSGVLVPADPLVMLDPPTDSDDADDAALRVAAIEALVETAQLAMDDALPALREWRALRDAAPA